ncbi:MAG: hypothetical protein IJV14_16815, partial [Lachnospiraceae bacterium]|nr:hypothetical protein [Lachnospiraceae bacterium]
VYRKFLYVVLTAAVVLVVLSTNMFPYKRLIEIPFFVSIFDRLEYPWRFMPLGTLMIAMVFVAVCMILSDQERVKGMLIMMVVCLITWVNVVQYEDRYMHDASQMLFSYDVDEVVMRNIMGGEFLLKGQTEFTDRIIRFDQSVPATAQIISRRGIHIESRIDNSSEDALNLDYPLTGYYGYRAWTTGKEPAEEPANTTMDSRKTGEKRQYLPVTASEDGRLRVTVPESFHGDVTVDFVESPLWRVSELISMIGAVILLLVIYRNMSSIFGRVGT